MASATVRSGSGPAGRDLMSDGRKDVDRGFMKRAIELAEAGWGKVAPNPLVGAVVVNDGTVVGEGWHRGYGEPHAEVEALGSAGARAEGGTLYVTLEPCSHHGKTPPCTDAIAQAGIREVVYACSDPNPVARGGRDVLVSSGIAVRSGVEREAAASQNASFFRAKDPTAPARPWLELKLALSLDGRIADQHGRSSWITGSEARTEVHRLRAGYDAIAVGIGTVLADDPLLTVRGELEPRTQPSRVIFDRRLRTPEDSRILNDTDRVPVWIVAPASAEPTRREALRERGARFIDADTLPEALRGLREKGMNSVFCEGGAGLTSALITLDLVDRLTLFFTPLFLGNEGLDPFQGLPAVSLDNAARWKPFRQKTFGDDTMISVDREPFDQERQKSP